MARIRFAHNSFSTGLISKKVQGNTEFEGYNNALDECTNFQVMHTGGVTKRGGTVFVANTKYNKPVKLFPFVYSSLESYMCEFGDLDPEDRHKGEPNTELHKAEAYEYGYPEGYSYNANGNLEDGSGRFAERGYIRFFTANGPVLDTLGNVSELFVPFTMEDLKKGNIIQEGNLINVVTSIGLYRIIRENNRKFRITVKNDYVNSPKTFSVNAPVYLKPSEANNKEGNYTIFVQNSSSDEDPIDEKYWGAIKKSDEGSLLYLKYVLDNGLAFYCLTITGVEFTGSRPHKIIAEIYPKFCVNCLKEAEGSDKPGNFKFPAQASTINWSIDAFTEDRGYPEAAALYERRLFLASNKEYPTGIWGSSLQFDNTMDFTPDNTSLGALQIKMGSQYTDKILWMIGQSKLFIGTSGGIFVTGAPDEKAQMSTANISVRLFDAVSASPLPPVVGGESVFFIDSSEKNVHEIILSSETGTYKANDVSLLANELTASGVVSHCWTQHPIKTYWCVTKAGYLCALTYLKNNGILAWSKHELAGGNSAKAECVAAMKHDGEDHLWLCVNRNKASGEDNRQIEYMSHSYNSRDVLDCQHYLDNGIFKTDETEIVKIETSEHTAVKGNFSIFNTLYGPKDELRTILFEKTDTDNILNKNIPFFIRNHTATEAVILMDFRYEYENIDGSGNQLSSKDRGMVDPTPQRFGHSDDSNTARGYYYEAASIVDFTLNNEFFYRVRVDSVKNINTGDTVVILAYNNEGLEIYSTKRDPYSREAYIELTVTNVEEELKWVVFSDLSDKFTGSMVSGKMYKRIGGTPMKGYTLGKETSVICKPREDDKYRILDIGEYYKVGHPDDPAVKITMLGSGYSSICYGGGKFVAVCEKSHEASISEDGINWDKSKFKGITSSKGCKTIAYGNGVFYGILNAKNPVYDVKDGTYIIMSEDGVNWNTIENKKAFCPLDSWISTCFVEGKFVTINEFRSWNGGQKATSIRNYTGHDAHKYGALTENTGWISVCYDQKSENVVAVDHTGNGARKHYDNDDDWHKTLLPSGIGSWNTVCAGNGKLFAVRDGSDSKGAFSDNGGVTWTAVKMPPSPGWASVCYGYDMFFAVSINGYDAAFSYSGTKWYGFQLPVSNTWKSVCYGDGKFIVVGDTNIGCVVYADQIGILQAVDTYQYAVSRSSEMLELNYLMERKKIQNDWEIVKNYHGNKSCLLTCEDKIFLGVFGDCYTENQKDYGYININKLKVKTLDTVVNYRIKVAGVVSDMGLSETDDDDVFCLFVRSIINTNSNMYSHTEFLFFEDAGDHFNIFPPRNQGEIGTGFCKVVKASSDHGRAIVEDHGENSIKKWGEEISESTIHARSLVCEGAVFLGFDNPKDGNHNIPFFSDFQIGVTKDEVGKKVKLTLVERNSDDLSDRIKSNTGSIYASGGFTNYGKDESTYFIYIVGEKHCKGYVAKSDNWHGKTPVKYLYEFTVPYGFIPDHVSYDGADDSNEPRFVISGYEGPIRTEYETSKISTYIVFTKRKKTGNFKTTEGEIVQLNSVPNMEDICNKDYVVKYFSTDAEKTKIILEDSWAVRNVKQPLDTCDKTDYETVGGNDARMLHYFTSVSGLNHLEGETVTVIANGKTFKRIVANGIVLIGTEETEVETLFCSVGLPFTASLKTVPLSGGNVTGSSVGCVGSQRSMVIHVFESWGGTYGTSAGEKRTIPYPKTADAIYSESEGLFTGTIKCPVINGDPTNRCIYIQHDEPTAFSLISVVQDVQVSDA